MMLFVCAGREISASVRDLIKKSGWRGDNKRNKAEWGSDKLQSVALE